MPLLTVLAPGTWVTVTGMELPNAVISRVSLKTGVDPVIYEIEWGPTKGPKRKARFRESQVAERPGTPMLATEAFDITIPTPKRPNPKGDRKDEPGQPNTG